MPRMLVVQPEGPLRREEQRIQTYLTWSSLFVALIAIAERNKAKEERHTYFCSVSLHRSGEASTAAGACVGSIQMVVRFEGRKGPGVSLAPSDLFPSAERFQNSITSWGATFKM